jgi:hypothetical protein
MTDKEVLEHLWRDSWHPPDRRPPWQWCEEHVETIPHSPKSGRFRSSESPWLREPLEEIANPRTVLISILAAIQSGKTLFAELGIAWKFVNSPCPMLVLHQKDDDASHYWVNRFRPFCEAIKSVKALMPKGDAYRTKIKKDFASFVNGATALFKGAFNKKNLQGHTIKEIWGDEVWQWPEGHMTEAEGRVSSYDFNSLVVFYSQGGEKDDDTDKKHETTDKREWNYKCPECEGFFPWEWSQVEWSDKAKQADGTYDFNVIRATAKYKCKGCSHEFDDTRFNRKAMNRAGKYFATNPQAPKGNVGFHWNQLVCKSWGYLAELYVRAKALARKGDMEELKKFYQKRLAISWEDNLEAFEADITPSNYDPAEQWEGEGIIHRQGFITERAEPVFEEDFESDEEGLEEARREYRDTMRGSTPLRFLTVDCQQTHFFAVVRAWAPDGSSRLLEWKGGEKGEKSLLLWEDIEELRAKWGVKPALTFIDNGFDTSNVNLECAKRGFTALQGSPRYTFNHRVTKRDKSGHKRRMNVERYYSTMKKVALGKKGVIARVHYWSNLHIKDTLARLRSNQDPAEGSTWEVFDGVEKAYLRQLDAEQRIKDGKTGKPRWVQIGKRPNHLLDCEAMQVVAATILRILGSEANVGTGAEADPDEGEE